MCTISPFPPPYHYLHHHITISATISPFAPLSLFPHKKSKSTESVINFPLKHNVSNTHSTECFLKTSLLGNVTTFSYFDYFNMFGFYLEITLITTKQPCFNTWKHFITQQLLSPSSSSPLPKVFLLTRVSTVKSVLSQ